MLVRRSAAQILITCAVCCYRWIPSELNAADGPSRRWGYDEARGASTRFKSKTGDVIPFKPDGDYFAKRDRAQAPSTKPYSTGARAGGAGDQDDSGAGNDSSREVATDDRATVPIFEVKGPTGQSDRKGLGAVAASERVDDP